MFIPNDSGFALIGDSYSFNRIGFNPGFGNHLLKSGLLIGINFHGIVLHPTRLRIVLGEFFLGNLYNSALLVKEYGAGTGRSLIKCDYIGFTHN